GGQPGAKGWFRERVDIFWNVVKGAGGAIVSFGKPFYYMASWQLLKNDLIGDKTVSPYKEQWQEAGKFGQEAREGDLRASSSPAGMAQVTAEGLAEKGKQFRKAIEEGDPAKAAQTVGGLTVNTGVMLEGAAPGGAAPPPAPALVTGEGVVMAGPA